MLSAPLRVRKLSFFWFYLCFTQCKPEFDVARQQRFFVILILSPSYTFLHILNNASRKSRKLLPKGYALSLSRRPYHVAALRCAGMAGLFQQNQGCSKCRHASYGCRKCNPTWEHRPLPPPLPGRLRPPVAVVPPPNNDSARTTAARKRKVVQTVAQANVAPRVSKTTSGTSAAAPSLQASETVLPPAGRSGRQSFPTAKSAQAKALAAELRERVLQKNLERELRKADPSRRRADNGGAAMVGRRLEIYFQGDQTFYAAKVVSFNSLNQHVVKYDVDGEQKAEELCGIDFRWIEDAADTGAVTGLHTLNPKPQSLNPRP